MGYLKEFLTQIHQRNFHKFLVLWEEYSTSDIIDFEEFRQLLRAVKGSELAKHFGTIVESALPLANSFKDESQFYEILSLLIDLQTTNSPALAEIATEAITKRHGNDPKFNERLRLTGLRSKEQFQGALAKYDLLAHMNKGKVVFHQGGWGTGEIIDISPVREHLVIEFENVSGRKDLSFINAFKTLIPLKEDHFLARRFADPDRLEQDGKNDPVGLIKLLLRDLGPKTAVEIKDELCGLVIPEADWAKWWQGARARMKKDPMLEMPESLKEPFILRKAQLSAEERLHQSLEKNPQADQVILSSYNFVRDNSHALKNTDTQLSISNGLIQLLSLEEISETQRIQIHLLLEQFFNRQESKEIVQEMILKTLNPEELVQGIEIIAFKKRCLLAIKEYRHDWETLYLNLLFVLPQSQLRDFLLKELNQNKTKAALEMKLKELLEHPISAPDMFVWYFQKLVSNDDEDEQIPFGNKEGRLMFFESFFVLFSYLENQPGYRELTKKMYNLLLNKRYELVRNLLQGTTIEYVKEFLLLASKCQTFTNHDMKILRSLTEVVHPSLAQPKSKKMGSTDSEDEIWTTEEGYFKTQERIRHIGTIEVVENAKEIEAARALGDLRENSEFKFAQEKRARLQSELKNLSDQLAKARIITPEDVHPEEVGIGAVVTISKNANEAETYTILGSWDANPDENILSLNSKFAQAMIGLKKGETFKFKDDSYKIESIGNFFTMSILQDEEE